MWICTTVTVTMLRTQGTTLHERLSQNGPAIVDNLYSHGGQEQVSESTYGQLNGTTDMSTLNTHHLPGIQYLRSVRIRISEGKGVAVEARMPCSVSLHDVTVYFTYIYLYEPIRITSRQYATHSTLNMHQHRLHLITRFLCRQLRLQQAHSPLQIHGRVPINDPLNVLFYPLHDLLQTLRGREVVVVWPREREERKMLPIFACTSCDFRGEGLADARVDPEDPGGCSLGCELA
jgi:hypothetical protein